MMAVAIVTYKQKLLLLLAAVSYCSSQQQQVSQQLLNQLPTDPESMELLVERCLSYTPRPGSGKFFTTETNAISVVQDGELGCLYDNEFHRVGGDKWTVGDTCVEMRCVEDRIPSGNYTLIIQQLKHCGPPVDPECELIKHHLHEDDDQEHTNSKNNAAVWDRAPDCCPRYRCPVEVLERMTAIVPFSDYDMVKCSMGLSAYTKA